MSTEKVINERLIINLFTKNLLCTFILLFLYSGLVDRESFGFSLRYKPRFVGDTFHKVDKK